MKRLTAGDVRGIWAGVPLVWNDDYSLDERSYRINTEYMCEVGVNGIYTTGSTGEFYAIDFQEFQRMVDIQDEICGKYEMPLQIGCCADNTREVIQLVKYAASKDNVGAVQIVIPYWMELNDREVLHFFKDIYTACPEMPIVHYNIPRAKLFLNAADYLRILEVAPSLIGVKYTFAGSNFGALQTSLIKTPQLSYFVAEDFLASAMQLGARGSYSSLIATNPAFMLTMYDLALKGRWDEAIAMQQTLTRFFSGLEDLLSELGEGMIDPVCDKGMAVACGCMVGSQRTRAPYIGWSDETVVIVREWVKANFPQFIKGAALDNLAISMR